MIQHKRRGLVRLHLLPLIAGICVTWPSAASAASTEGSQFLPSSGPQFSAEETATQYAKQDGIAYEEALRRVLIQEREHGLPEELQKALGSSYAGTWINQTTGDVQVGLLSSSDRPVIEAALARRELSVAEAIVPVTTSLVDLEAALYTLTRELKPVITSQAATIGISESANRVIVTLAPKASSLDWGVARELRNAFARGTDANGPPLPPLNPTPFSNSQTVATGPQPARRVAATVELVAGPEFDVHAASCGSSSCGLPLRAGVSIRSEINGSAADCSAGFISTWWSGSQTYFFIMDAGHCIFGEPRNNWEAESYPTGKWHSIGEHWSWRFGNAGGEPSSQNGQVTFDAAIINMSYANYWTNVLAHGPLWMHGWPSGTEWELHGQARPVEGEYGCRSGASTTYTCGHAGKLDTVWGYPATAVSNLMEVPGACLTQGDSGGPFVDGSTALGIASGYSLSTPCVGLYTKVVDISYWFGVYVY